MGVKRGQWKSEEVSKAATINSKKYGAKPATVPNDGRSRSEAHLQDRAESLSTPPIHREVSQHRREELVRFSEQRPGGNNPASSPAPLVVFSSTYKDNCTRREEFEKTANVTMGGTRIGAGSTSRMAPEVYSPLFQIANLQLPRDRITMNAWNRNFYDTHPLVHNCINLHATYPINKINIKCKDAHVEAFFNELSERLDLISVLQSMALEFWKIGEVFPYCELSENTGSWKDIFIQNPDYVHVKKSVLSEEAIISMRPDAALQRLVGSSNPADAQLRSQIDEEVLYYIKKGQNIPLDNFNVSHLKMTSSPYDIRGTSPIVSIYKDLMHYDKLRESKFAQADSLINPITLVKIGGTGEGSYLPTPQDLESWRQTFEAAAYDKDFKIISHASVDISRVGASGAIVDISNDLTFILDNILYGLYVPKAILTQDGASFSSASIGLEVLRQRYEAFRNMMAQWLIKKVFAPISEIQEFYVYKNGEKKLIVPDVEWNKMVLFDMDSYIGQLSGLVEKGSVSKRTLFHSLGLNYEEEQRRVKEEMIHNVILAKEQQILSAMSLAALRSKAQNPDEDIIEPTEEPLPGTPGSEEAGIPGVEPDMDMGLDMGGMDMGLDMGGMDIGPGAGDLGAPDIGGGDLI